MKTPRLLCCLIALFCLPLAAETRTFTGTSGRLLKGELVSVNGEMVTIKREDGQEFVMKASSFSNPDIEYFKAHGLQSSTATGPAANPPEPLKSKVAQQPDPIVGKWAWRNGDLVLFNVDGTAKSKAASGTWQFLKKGSPRAYEAKWSTGERETYELVKNGEELTIKGRPIGNRVHDRP